MEPRAAYTVTPSAGTALVAVLRFSSLIPFATRDLKVRELPPVAAPAIASGRGPGPASEAELAAIWESCRFPPEALTTTAGAAVEVVYPGRRNGGAGPDFRDAVLRVDGRERRGDVELHLRASYFHAHGHDGDPAYDNVVLHVVYEADEGETRLSSGARVPVAAFAPWLARRAGELEGWLSAPPLWQEPCRDAAARLGDDAVTASLTAAGRERFERRVAYLAREAEAHGEEEALWRALIGALGYGGDSTGFRRLAETLSAAQARRLAEPGGETTLETVLRTAAGLLPQTAALAGLTVLQPALAAGRGRPANRPERRIAAFARLYGRAGGDLAAYARASVAAAKSPRDLVARWCVAPPAGGPALIGPARAAEIVLNAVLPFAATTPPLVTRAFHLAAALSAAPPYGKTLFLERALVRLDGRRRPRRALEQQGLLAYLEDWCSRGGCGRCPLS
jgi:hypothetical protein